MTSEMAEAIQRQLDVSRETTARLSDLAALLIKWNNAINLVSNSTVDQVWQRHILDSAQIFEFGKDALRWADLGSGGGFPGLVVAILALEKAPRMQITLVESDQRKAAFLRQASQGLGLSIRVLASRIESIAPLAADVLSARALAPLPKLCAFANLHLAPQGRAIFMKGKAYASEIVAAQEDWTFTLASHESITDPSAVVLVLNGIAHV